MTDRQKGTNKQGVEKHFFHVTPSKTDGKWRIKEVGSKNEPAIYDDKETAVKEAEKLAKNEELGHVVIHDEHGKFEVVGSF
ncbi:MAG: hypothetical protein PG981_000634 [Wolbachia endosymbiont of Ctenocephalides orientis wCori]|nr:MAG: hypothetical protein PG981_000634 [Wolbachia endosymbiont of Ctenocephalides orientis wCori]